MSKATALKYTAAEKRAVDAGWFALMRAVESSRDQERRINEAVKARKAGRVTLAGARHFVIETVRSAMLQLGPNQVDYLARESDEYILCYFVGAWLKRRTQEGEYPSKVWDDLTEAYLSHRAAHLRYLESI